MGTYTATATYTVEITDEDQFSAFVGVESGHAPPGIDPLGAIWPKLLRSVPGATVTLTALNLQQ